MIDDDRIREALMTVIDPEVGIDIVNLGLLETIAIGDDGKSVRVDLIMTTPACPQGGMIVDEARYALLSALGPGHEVVVEIVDDPFWTPDRMSESARSIMGW